MTVRDNPESPMLEGALSELAKLRALSRQDIAPKATRRAIKARARKTLEFAASSRAPRADSRTRSLLIGVAIAVAVPGALAATDVGRDWLRQGAAWLPWMRFEDQTATTPREAFGEVEAPAPGTASPLELGQAHVISVPSPISTAPNPIVKAATTATSPALRAASDVPVAPAPSTAAQPKPSAATQLHAERRLLEAARLALTRGNVSTAKYWCGQHREQFDKPILEQERRTLEALILERDLAAGSEGSIQ